MFLIGYDIGSSSIKAALVEAATGRVLGRVQEPERELEIQAPRPDWAEQDPEIWWQCVCRATQRLLDQGGVDSAAVAAIGISYQMHGLVLVDDRQQVLRPSIIWCDSRAVEIGRRAFRAIGPQACLGACLNSPGNFTASKLRWVMENEPDTYARVAHALLPGDFIALRLTGAPTATVTGLSEGIFWDFAREAPAQEVLNHYGIEADKLPPLVPIVGMQGRVTAAAAAATGLKAGTPVTYRAGDQPNNALTLNVLQPGEVAATAGTSGVIYAVTDRRIADPLGRINSFAHVTHEAEAPRIGLLLCINGAGSMHRWLRRQVAEEQQSYEAMEAAAAQVPAGAEGLSVLPFGNGAERLFDNRIVGAHVLGLDLNRHQRAHLFRAGLEGVAFAFAYGMDVLRELGQEARSIRVGNDNMFQSEIFAGTVAALTGATIEVYDTTGAVGAARAAGVGVGAYGDLREALAQQTPVGRIDPRPVPQLSEAYERWRERLQGVLEGLSKTQTFAKPIAG